MSKRAASILAFSVIVVVIWIGYTVYTNIATPDYTNNQGDIAKYDVAVDTNLHTKTLENLNNLSGNVKVHMSDLTSNSN